MSDPFDLQRFVEAQKSPYERVRTELIAGRKASHWMWFIFPQFDGLGSSFMAQKYAIASLAEAQAYLVHPILGPRLRDCTALVNAHKDKAARAILGSPDDMKFRSCLTLFARATDDNAVFVEALKTFYDGQEDQATLDRLADPG